MANNGGGCIRAVPERVKLHGALTLFQFGHAGNHVLLRAALDMGVSKLVFPFYRNCIALLVLAPFAYFAEKKDRPPLTFSFLIQFFVHGLIGITLNQGLYLVGLQNTSPTFATAMDNAIPAMTFLMATIFRLEQVHWKRRDGIAKVVGTIASVVGATVMTVYKGPIIYKPSSGEPDLVLILGGNEERNWSFGCVCLVLRCVCWSSWFVLQAPLLKKYPARLSVASFTCFFSILQFFAIAVSVERDPRAWLVGSGYELFIVFYSGLIASGMAFAIQIWVIDRSGPVFMSLYLPLQILLVAILSSFLLGEEFFLGGIVGAVLIITGLYAVLWGKNEETRSAISDSVKEERLGKSSLVQPLLPNSNK